MDIHEIFPPREKPEKRPVVLNARITEEMEAELEKLAAAVGYSKSEAAYRLLRTALDRLKASKPAKK